jgi:hypothetical protein
MTMALAVFFGRTAARRGRFAVLDWGMVLAAGLLSGWLHWPVAVVLFGAAGLGALSAYARGGGDAEKPA